ncbi:uncharacterized protein LOC131242454 isoform X2 [Magnolia sinica]|uniref:uncharacterized protein LOC131242454 isoform X2 n=1 Tax=Magnolia sinica TaxID=86752 RepID=UPI00265AA280|nr:uncharacterized protein LOC131242454 isoform X2 [Magnolia sinica]
MESMPVNWEALDSLVINFAKSENLLEDSSSSSSSASSPSSSSYRSRLLIRQIRRSLEIGDIDSAIDLLRIHAPAVLHDHRLLFRLQKQKFIELLRRGTASDRDSAIQCLRTALAPCALDAYPEAYEEFKHVLLAFIFDKEDQTSPVANEWSEKRRYDIAGLLSSVLRAHLQAYDPIFSMTLRYLISIHKGFCFRQGVSSPISDLTERLLLEERDPPATPQESLYEAPPFDEVDIQALAHAVELTRQGAVDSLRFAKGDLFQAFQNELCQIKLDVPMLDELVHEYCVYRGIVDGGLALPSGLQTPTRSSKVYQADLGSSSSRDCSSFNMDCGTGRNSDGETSVNNVDMEGSQEATTDAVSTRGHDVELRYAHEVAGNRDDCSTSETHQSGTCGRRSPRSRSHATGERSRRKRWRGRVERLEVTPDFSFVETSKQELVAPTPESNASRLEEEQVTTKHSVIVNVENGEDHKYDIVLEMRELAHKGMAAEVVEEVNAMDPNFFEQNPVLLFQLKQVEFLKLVNCGDHSRALRVACSYLGPLAASNPALLKPLKETLLALLRPNEDAIAKGIPLSVLATSLQVAMGRRLGIKEPQLMKIMRATLHTHNEWFRLQMCKDRFEGLLKIDCLKEIDATLSIDATSKAYADTCTHGSSQVTISSGSRMPEDGSSPTPVSSRDVVCDETAILKVMEFLALPRADAIHLLAQYNGNAETVIQQIFA